MTASVKTIDFTKVKDGGQFNRNRIPAGDYLAKIIDVTDAQAKDETFQYLFTIQIVKRASSKHPYYCKLQENQLWKIRNLFIAAGKAVPKSKTKIDPNTIVGKLIGVTVDDTEYEEKEQSEITAVFPAAELGDADGPDGDEEEAEEEEEDEDDAPLEDDEEEEDEAEEDPYAGLDRTALKRAIVKLQPDFQAKKSQDDDALREVLRGLAATSDDEEDEEEEEEPAPVKKKAAAKAPVKKTAAKKKATADDSDEDLEDLDIDDM